MSDSIKINWYRTKIDKAVMSDLMRKSDGRALAQVIPQLLLYLVTAALAFLAFKQVHRDNLVWSVPLVLAALFVHGTLARFFGGIACHEFSHKTPFATQRWNTFFIRIYAFLAWFDPVGYRASHIRHHQVTAHQDHDGEIVLPQGLDWHGTKFVVKALTIDLRKLIELMRFWGAAAGGRTDRHGFFRAEWLSRVLPETDAKGRREFRIWARIIVFGHLGLAAVFVATGNWFLILIVTFGCQYCGWLEILCAAPQHIGLSPDVNDYRLNTRTYTCGWLPAFCYWNMQYHVEHHMFPAVPFYHLPALRRAIQHDLPPATHGLWRTWQQLLPIMRRQRREPGYVYVPPLPHHEGERVGDDLILRDAAGA